MKNSSHKAAFVTALSAIMIYGLIGLPASAVKSGASSPAGASTPNVTVQSNRSEQAEIIDVVESGDPDAPEESFSFDEGAIEKLLKESNASNAFPTEKRKYKNAQRMSEAMIGYALAYANDRPPVTRKTNPQEIRKFVNLFFNDKDESLPYCAMGVAYVATKAYCELGPEKIAYSQRNPTRTFRNVLPLIKEHYFTPSPSCLSMMKAAMKRRPSQRGGWIAKGARRPRRGWLVLYDWKNKRGEGDGVPDHVGIVTGVDPRDANTIYTVEFNTSIRKGSQSNGGAVAKKVRNMRDVQGFIRMH